ncbi:MAG: hypothetical protein COW16_10445 [Sphingomonadales bacterium CG12_big_fil_rev_8_21_14_0_65_65_10]|nr:MAG: hypothetical protein COW16_10445 [Sphingomonadales bacterium CG12_big_fil_rev_8_21_14_0_65_65_10]
MLLALTLALSPLPPSGSAETFACTPTHVWDGDGPIWCAEGPHVRLQGIAARELDGSCLPNHPCPPASGIAARDALVKLVGRPGGVGRYGHILVEGPTMECRRFGQSYNRVVARCVSPIGGDLSEAMIRTGYALRW